MKKMEFTMKRFVLALFAMFTAVTGAFAQSAEVTVVFLKPMLPQ
jgi:ABC-type sugar transport system substrate-binding protein